MSRGALPGGDPAERRARRDGERKPAVADLRSILEQSRPALEAGIADAQRELDELHAREGELQTLIARAKAALGELDVQPAEREPPPGERLTLHEAMRLVLSEPPA